MCAHIVARIVISLEWTSLWAKASNNFFRVERLLSLSLLVQRWLCGLHVIVSPHWRRLNCCNWTCQVFVEQILFDSCSFIVEAWGLSLQLSLLYRFFVVCWRYLSCTGWPGGKFAGGLWGFSYFIEVGWVAPTGVAVTTLVNLALILLSGVLQWLFFLVNLIGFQKSLRTIALHIAITDRRANLVFYVLFNWRFWITIFKLVNVAVD